MLPAGWLLRGGYLIGASADLSHEYLTNADLTRIKSGGITVTPSALPTGWVLSNGYLVGPSADLRNADLGDADLTGVAHGNITGSPALPAPSLLRDGYLIGPSPNLMSTNLTGAVDQPGNSGRMQIRLNMRTTWLGTFEF